MKSDVIHSMKLFHSSETRQRGFTLLEVMLAVAIVGTALGGIALAIGRCMAAAKATDDHTTAHVLLEDKLQEFNNETNFVMGVSNGDFGTGAANYQWRREVVQDDSQLQGLYRQTISVTWRDRGREMDVTLTGMLFSPNAETGSDTSNNTPPKTPTTK